MRYISYTTANSPSLLQKAVAVIATIAVAGLALMFSAVLLAVILIAGAIAWAYIWWKTREVRKQMQQQMQDFPPDTTTSREVFEDEVFEGEVIEGEVIRVDTKRDTP